MPDGAAPAAEVTLPGTGLTVQLFVRHDGEEEWVELVGKDCNLEGFAPGQYVPTPNVIGGRESETMGISTLWIDDLTRDELLRIAEREGIALASRRDSCELRELLKDRAVLMGMERTRG